MLFLAESTQDLIPHSMLFRYRSMDTVIFLEKIETETGNARSYKLFRNSQFSLEASPASCFFCCHHAFGYVSLKIGVRTAEI